MWRRLLLNASVGAREQSGPAALSPDKLANHPRLRAFMEHRKAVRQRVAHKLGLSADQIAQFKAERAKVIESVKGIRADTALTPEQKRQKIRETVIAARTEARGALTPEQYQMTLEQMGYSVPEFEGDARKNALENMLNDIAAEGVIVEVEPAAELAVNPPAA